MINDVLYTTELLENKTIKPHPNINYNKQEIEVISLSLQTNKNNIVYFVDGNNTINELFKKNLSDYITEICVERNITYLDVSKITNNVFSQLKKINTLDEIDCQIISSASEMAAIHYDYPQIAMYLLISALHKNTTSNFSELCDILINNVNEKGNSAPIISRDYYNFVKNNSNEIQNMINYEKDYDISLFGYRTLEKAYLKKLFSTKIVERPQHLYMRVSIAIHRNSGSLKRIKETYNLISNGYFTHATPTLFNAGTPHEQLSSCFLLGVDDNMESIGECWKDCAIISKNAGGIGINTTSLRPNGTYIHSTQGTASGLRVLKVFDEIARYADQGGKRAGSIAIYIEPWHADIFFFLQLRKNTGAETERARDLFLALMINDIFMRRVENDETWSLMCPSECPNLLNKFGNEFDEIYINYEKKNKFIKQCPARELWYAILDAQIETGNPYMLYKDAVNLKSNQMNIGVINGSNLCAEILEYSSSDEYAVCNLVSICLPKFVIVIDGEKTFDYKSLYKVAKIATRNLNNIIDINYYPLEKTRKSNLKHRPIGIGIQGLADLFAIMGLPFESEKASTLNKEIMETIYFGAITQSAKMAIDDGAYMTFPGSPISKGLFQFDLWGLKSSDLSGMWDWDSLRKKVVKSGVRNSLTTALMPTASTSQIMNNIEAFEPMTENIYSRATIAGDFYVVNKHLMRDLINLGIWNEDMVDLIKYYNGSVQKIDNIPQHVKDIYKTAWEIPCKTLIELCVGRAPFVDQTQSFNLFITTPNYHKLTSAHLYGWKKGLKTGMYYLRSKSASEANNFGIDIDKIKQIEKTHKQDINTLNESDDEQSMVCKIGKNLKTGEICYTCSS